MTDKTAALTMDRLDVKNPCGRLLVVRFATPELHSEEIIAFRAKMKAVVSRIIANRQKFVVVCDMRALHVLSPDSAKFMIEILKSDNPALERSAILIGRRATLGLQVDRIINESRSPSRKRFYEYGQMHQWLAPVLAQDELDAAKSFLSSYPVPIEA